MRFYDLKVIRRSENKSCPDGRKIVMWECECSCGKKTIVAGNALKRGHTKSCGCRRNRIKGNKYDISGEYGVGWTDSGDKFYFDIDDYELISKYTWYMNANGYLFTLSNGQNTSMHRLVMGNPSSEYEVDHIKHVTFDNRKSELRVCKHQDNVHNHINHKHNKSGVSGVHFDNQTQKWRAQIKVNNKTISIGRFILFDDAVKARKDAEEKYFGEYSYDNSQEVINNG